MLDNLLLNTRTRIQLEYFIRLNPVSVQSVVLSGEKGLGKSLVAMELARFLLNYGGKMDVRRHPDFLLVKSESGIINKAAVDAIKEFAGIRTTIAPRRVIVMDDANLMNDVAANALLKLIEDGNQQCVFVFVAHERLLNTIMSRCLNISFYGVFADELKSFVGDDFNELAAAACGGRIGFYKYLVSEAGNKFLSSIGMVADTMNQMKSEREILTVCHAVKEKDSDLMYDNFSQEERAFFLSFFQTVFIQHLYALVHCGEELPFLKGENISKFYDCGRTIGILKKLEEAQATNKIKGRYSRNDFLETLFAMVEKERR